MRLARLALVALVAVGGVGALRDGGELSPPRAAADSSPQTPPALFLRSAGQSSKSDAAAAIIREIFEAQDDENCGYISCDEAIAAAKMLGALSSASFEAFDPRDSEVTSVRACAHCCCACLCGILHARGLPRSQSFSAPGILRTTKSPSPSSRPS